MASKRNLYRPAQVQENVGQRKTRKTLAQGRLISSASDLQKIHNSAVSSSSGQVLNTSGNVSRLHNSLIQGQLEESIFSPRRQVPQASEPRNGTQGPQTHSLDLSDSDDYSELPNGHKRLQIPPEILCIDASRQTVNADRSEVDIRIGFDRTPVKVICHSPARINQSLSGLHNLASREQENMAQDLSSSHNSPHTVNSKAVIKEKLIDDPSEPRTAVQSIPMSPSLGSRRILQTLPSNLPQPNFDDTSDSDASVPRVSNVFVENNDHDDDNLSVISDIVSEANKDQSDIKEVKVIRETKKGTRHQPARLKIEQQTRKPSPSLARKNCPSSTRKDPGKRPETDKKKKGRVVPSRYMQDLESRAKMSLTAKMDKTVLDKTQKASKSMEVPSSAKKPVRKTARSAEAIKPLKLKENRPQTPENQSIASSAGGKTSTPTMDGTFFSHEMEIDASAIHPEVSLLAADTSRSGKPLPGSGKTQSRVRQDLKDELMGQSIISNLSLNQTKQPVKPKQKLDLKATQQKLNLIWMYNLQWAFLEAKARKTLDDQERQAMAQIYGIHEECEKLRKVKAEKQQHLEKLRHMNHTDYMTEVQRQCLGPVINNLSTLKKQHQCLAEALDTTRHQIATKDIHLPDNEDQFQARLEAHLLESERLLGEISAVTRQDGPKVAEMANAMVTMETAVGEMDRELKKSRELLAATETLTMHECSLRVQEIQLQELDQS